MICKLTRGYIYQVASREFPFAATCSEKEYSPKHFTQQNIIQYSYQSYCNYLLKMGRMDKEQAVFEQLTLSDFKEWSSTTLKANSQNFANCKPFQNDENCFSP